MTLLRELFTLLIFPGGLFIIAIGMIYIWIDRKVVARLQNRIGPRWFQPLADMVKLLVKEELVPNGVNRYIFAILPLIALAGPLTAALYIPMAGLQPAYSFSGDLIVTIYMMSLLTLSTGLAGANTINRFSLIGATRTLTQLFAYEAPFLLALLGPAIVAGSWNIQEIAAYGAGRWLAFTQPIGFVIALIGLVGKLEMAPFRCPGSRNGNRRRRA
jgi:NADH-quinone oxidoreductase subunit H